MGYDGQPIKEDITKMLFEAGADVNQPMYDEDRPLHMAGYGGHKWAMDYLIKNGADPEAQNDQGKTPWHHMLNSQRATLEVKGEILRDIFSKLATMAKIAKTADYEGKTVIDYTKEFCPDSLNIFAALIPVDNALPAPAPEQPPLIQDVQNQDDHQAALQGQVEDVKEELA